MTDSDTNIIPLLLRPPGGLSVGDIVALRARPIEQHAQMGEMALYEQALAFGRSDPYAAHKMILDCTSAPDFESKFPRLRVLALADLVCSQKRIEAADAERADAELASGLTDQARYAAFRANPGRYVEGATRSPVPMIHPAGFGVVRIYGRDHIWTKTGPTKVAFDLGDLARAMERGRWPGGLLVGAPEAEHELSLPSGYRYVPVDLLGEAN